MRVSLLVSSFVAAATLSCVHAAEEPCAAGARPAEIAPAAPAKTAVSVAEAPPPPPAVTPPASEVPPPPPPPAFEAALETAAKAIASSDFATADRQLDVAAAASGSDFRLHFAVARYRATRFAFAGDFERAASSLVQVLPELAKHPESDQEFWTHNAMMMVRESQGDPAAAIAENDQATIAAARGTWSPNERETLAYLKDRWHRAYLTRMLAETRAGSVRDALVAYAEASLDDYRARARKLGSNEESIAVLEAYFAALDGRREDALRAARKVDPAKDDDIEDLYLVVVGFEAGGDHAAAENVRKRMRQLAGVRLSVPVMLRWLEHDAKPGDKAFTPWHPKRSGQ